MKVRITIYLIILLAGVGIFLYVTPDKSNWNPWYCSQYSGFHSYAWGGGSGKCTKAGCSVEKIREIDDPQIFDDEGFEYKCVR